MTAYFISEDILWLANKLHRKMRIRGRQVNVVLGIL